MKHVRGGGGGGGVGGGRGPRHARWFETIHDVLSLLAGAGAAAFDARGWYDASW